MPTDEFSSKMLKYIKYGMSIRTTEADGLKYYLVGINFKPSWDIVEPSDDSNVFCMPSTESEGQYYYFSEVSNGLNVIFESIEDTIHHNEDIEKKVALLKEKITELQELFATESYDRLVHYEFKYIMPKKDELPKRGKGRPKKLKVEEPINKEAEKGEPPVEETVIEETHEIEKTELPIEEKVPEVDTNPGTNLEEASEIDKKIAAALGKI